MKKILYIVFSLTLMIMLTACSGNSSSSNISTDGSKQEKDMVTEELVENKDSKIIINTYLQVETLEFDKTTDEVQRLTKELGGYIASSNVNDTSIQSNYQNTRYANYQLKIPKNNVNKFIEEIKKHSNIINTSTDSVDVTTQYQDTESRINVLKTREERLLELLKSAQNLSDTITLDKALSEVIYEREKLQGSLNKLNEDITYTAVNIDISEVNKYNTHTGVNDSFIDKVINTLVSSINNTFALGEGLLLSIIGLIPVLVLFLPLIAIIYFVVKKYKNK